MKKRFLFGGAAALLAAPFAAAWGVYRYAFYHLPKSHADPERVHSGTQYLPYRERMLTLIRDVVSRPYEPVRITSRDNLILFGRYYHQADGAPLEIMFHGYHGTGARDFCGGFHLAWEAGHNVLLVDQRAHGESEGKVITFGIREREDCVDWCRYAVRRFGSEVKIWLAGVSMGASTVLMASELPLPPQVQGIMADCPYDSPAEIVKKVARDFRVPLSVLYPLARMGARLFGNFDLEGASPMEAVKKAKVPILFIHGEDDRYVPCDMGRRDYEACASEKMLFTVPGAGHCLSYLVDEEGYRKAVQTFQKR